MVIMAKTLYTALAMMLSLMTVSSCTPAELEADIPAPVEGNTILHAAIGEKTRAVLDGSQIIWQEGDQINVMTKGSHNCGAFTLESGAGSREASFRGGDIDESAKYYALYPHQSGMTKSGGRYRFNILQDQTYVESSVGRGANIMVASFTDPSEKLQFLNVLGLLRLSLTGNIKVYKISVTDSDPSNLLWGRAGLLLDNTLGTDSQSLELTDGDNQVNLLCPDGVQLSSVATTFFIAVPPGSFSSGMTVKIYGSDLSAPLDEFSSAKNNEIKRTAVRAMPARPVIPDLSVRESANCYPVYTAGYYKFKAVKGNGSDSVGEVKSAQVLWETRNSATAPTAGQIISGASYANGYVSFMATGLTGNAVIAAKDASDNILWSWHIWVPGSEIKPLQRESNYLMDRNLGALYSGHPTSGDGINTVGLFYEWGRKDPFPGPSSWSASGVISTAATVGGSFSSSERTSETGTVEWTLAHPQTFLYCKSATDSDQDWLYSHDNTLWAATKTIYDPCPAGYHVPGYKDWYTCSATFDESGTWFGADINYYGSSTSWFPCGGYRFTSDGANHAAGYQAYWWSYDANGNKSRAAMMKPTNTSNKIQTATVGRAIGANVRCIADSLPEEPLVPKGQTGSTVNVKGTVTCEGNPVEGVVVSDGVEVAVTDSEGHYELSSRKEKGYVFISIPSGYTVPIEGANTPLFWKSTTCNAATAETINFSLIQEPDQQKFKFIAIGDIQVNNLTKGDDIRQFNEVFAPDFHNYLSSHSGERMFVLTLGDHSWNDYWADHDFNLDDFKAMWDAQVNGIQVFYTPGNHDNDRGQDGVFPTTNDEAKRKYRSLFGPSNYSFNMGAFHFIALDNVWCYNLGQQDGTKRRGTMSYKYYITDEQLEWVEKDLAHVAPETPLIISAHVPFFKFNGTNNLAENSTSRLLSLLGGRRAYLFSGHTHMVYNVDHLDDMNVFEFNNGGLAGATYHVDDFATSSDGSPCGYRIVDVDGTSVSWTYKGYKMEEQEQFRVYDRNETCLAPAQWIPDCTNEESLEIWNQRVSWYLEPSSDNLVVINVWDWDPSWTVEVLEGSTSLEVEHVAVDSDHDAERMDPLFLATFEANAFNANKTSAGSFRAFPYAHIFRAQASSASSTLTVKVTNRFGRVFTKTITRPYAFDINSYNP